MALGALGISLILLGGGLWVVRFSIAAFMLEAALSERGADADFEFINLDFNSAALANVRFGPETSPDATIPLVEARWRWEGISPHLHFLRVVRPRLHFRMDEGGRVSAGSLERLSGGAPGRRRPSIPAIELEILEGQALVDTPFGPLTANLQSSGTIGRDFTALGEIARTSHAGEAYALEAGAAELVIVSRDENIAFRLNASANALSWDGAHIAAPTLRILGRAPLDLARYDVELTSRAASFRGNGVTARAITAAIGFEGIARATQLGPETWAGEARGSAGEFSFDNNRIQHARFEGRVDGAEARGQGRWNISGGHFDGLSLISEQPHANGVFRFDLQGDESLSGEARIVFAQSRLNEAAQTDLRSAFPDIAGAPVGPTFAQAERALDDAADRFDLSIPVAMTATEDGLRVRIAAPAEARASTGTRVLLSPLRQDGPALVLQWPGPALSGAIALELSGGGAPNASLLLDTVSWTPGAPFEADGTLTLANWRAETASISANELGIGIVVQPQGGGHIDLRGPTRITGPLGDGEVRDLVATLDLGVHWGNGWRVTPNSACLPISLGGIDAAGLSFANGDFSLCPLNGALIAADANANLSGGFSIRSLGLNGRMSGPEGQPARLSANNIVGLFSGRSGDFTLALEADTPQLSIQMTEERTLSINLQSITADAHIADSWSIAGSFDAGSLTDPTLPGSVSAIEGLWTAEPVDNKPVIRVDAGEALLTANRPPTQQDRPLFNPLRIVDANAIMRDGQITASGNIVLEERTAQPAPSTARHEGARQLASFTAHHIIDEGAGGATVVAEQVTFGPQLQPYEITEQARGMVEGVTGPISANAQITWTRDTLLGAAHINLQGRLARHRHDSDRQ